MNNQLTCFLQSILKIISMFKIIGKNNYLLIFSVK